MQLHVGLKTCNKTDDCCRICYEQTWRLRIFKTDLSNSLWSPRQQAQNIYMKKQMSVVFFKLLLCWFLFRATVTSIYKTNHFGFFFKFETHLNLMPGGGSEVAIRTLEGVCVQVSPLVVLHVRASVKRLHAYSTGKPFSVQTGGAYSGGRGRSFTAQLMENGHSQGQRIELLLRTKNLKMASPVTSTCWRTPSERFEAR